MAKILEFIQWWTGLNHIKKALSFLLMSAIWLVVMILSLNGTFFNKKDNLTIKETVDISRECEQRAARMLAEERHRCDSTSSAERKEFNDERKTLYQRTNRIENRNIDIKKALE